MTIQSKIARLGGIKGIGGSELTPMLPDEVKRLEDLLKCQFPETYSQFLLQYGASTLVGESPNNPFIVFRPLQPMPSHFESGFGMLDAFYGGKKDNSDAYSLEVRIYAYTNRMPKSLLPIGDDGGYGQICLGISGDEYGKVYYWDQSNEPLDENTYLEDYGIPRPAAAMFDNVTQIAESFEDFVLRLEFMKE